jgi:serine/threonine protein kinase
MPSPTTIDEFLDLMRKSGVVEEKRLDAQMERLRAAGSAPNEPSKLAGILVASGILTHFQAEQFLLGKWRRFTIGKYKVLERLGSGGMGSVYLCEHKLMRRRVAVKVLPPAKAEDSSSLERFYREARAVAALDHPNIVRAYDIDQDDKLHFLVMEHVDGSNLQEIVKKTGPMDVLRAAHYMRQSALGLQHAHETAGLVHRDIKPGNILVDRNGIVKILDMGLARFFHDEEDILTRKYDENVLGTADYLAPEQIVDSHVVDIRADIYSLGVTFFFCLTGKPLFSEGSVAQKLIWHQTRQPKPLRSVRPDVPEEFAAILEKMMAKDPSQRYPTPQAVAVALEPFTQTPIPPPPEIEMPQLSPAARGQDLSSLSRGASDEVSPSPRKSWQVPSSAVRPVPPSPKPTPPSGGSALPPPRPGTPPQQIAPVKTRTPVRTPALEKKAPSPLGKPPSVRPPLNGQFRQSPTAGAERSAPLVRPAPEDESPSWEKLAADTDHPSAHQNTASESRRQTISFRKQSFSQILAAMPRTQLWWLVGGIATLVVLLLILLFWWLLPPGTPPETPEKPTTPVFFINRGGQPGAFKTLQEALGQVKAKPSLGARIIVQMDLSESGVIISTPNVTIETDHDNPLIWKSREGDAANSNLLTVSSAPGFHLKGFLLDGVNRPESLIVLFGHCPGARFENLELKNFLKQGIYVSNCEGSPEARILMSRLHFTTQVNQAGLFFHLGVNSDITKNRFFTIRDDCSFDGPGTKIKVSRPEAVENIQWPPGISLTTAP